MPKVSILTLSYNKGPFLAECLESVLAQTYPDWECIVVDDGSTDNTWEVAQAYAAKDPRIKAYHKENWGYAGLAATHNFALERASGALIAILDGDDLWPPERLAHQVPVHDDPEVVLSYGQFVFLTPEGHRPGATPPFRGSVPTSEFLKRLLVHQAECINVTLMMSRKALEAVGNFHQDGSNFADMPTNLRLAMLPGKVVYIPKTLGIWRQHAVQATRTVGAQVAEYNLMLCLRTLLDLPPEPRKAIGLEAADILRARYPMIADAYFAATRGALLRRDVNLARKLAHQLWFYGGPKRKLQALYARWAAPLGLTYEPILRLIDQAQGGMIRRNA